MVRRPARAPGRRLLAPAPAAARNLVSAVQHRLRAADSVRVRQRSDSQTAARTASAAPRRTASAGDFAALVAAALLLQSTLLQVSVVRGASMEPTLRDGDRLVVDRLDRSLGGIARGDVVVLRNPGDTGVDFVKRVVGLPGDRVALRAGRLLVDGREVGDFEHVRDDCDMAELLVPDDHVFVLGDNRPVSADSREFGIVPAALLLGTVRARVWPPARASLL